MEKLPSWEEDIKEVDHILNYLLINNPKLQQYKEDIKSDCLLRLVKCKSKYSSCKNMTYKTYRYMVIKQAFLMFIRTIKAKKRAGITISLDEELQGKDKNIKLCDTIPYYDDLDRNIKAQEIRAIFEIELAKIKNEKKKDIFKMYLYDGLKPREIAKKVQVTEQYIYNVIARFIKNLKITLQKLKIN